LGARGRAYNIFVGNPEEKRRLGRPGERGKNNIVTGMSDL
jgi:hypothetical protein